MGDSSDLLVVLDVFVKALELSDLKRQYSHQNHDHQQEGVDSSLDQILHLQRNPYTHRPQVLYQYKATQVRKCRSNGVIF